MAGQPAVGKVHREVALLREHAHAPFSAHGDPRRSDRRDCAVDEADAGIGDIGMLTGHRRADSIHTLDLARDQRQDQVEIVDHQIENYRHVGAPLLERCNSSCLDVERGTQPSLDCCEGGRKTFLMADLQYQTSRRGRRGEFIGLRKRCGNRLLHQHMLSRPQRLGSQRMVCLGRRCDHQRVTDRKQRREVHRRRGNLRTYRPCTRGIRIEHAGQRRASGLGDLQRVMAAKMADTGNADTEW